MEPRDDGMNLFGSSRQKVAPPDTSEKATVRSRNVWEDYGVTLKEDGELTVSDYRDMLRRDPQVKACVQFKILARLSSGWQIKPASTDPTDLLVAKFVTDQLEQMQGAPNGFLRRAMGALALGLSVHEIVLQPIESGEWAGKIGLRALKEKRAEQFRIKTDPFGNVENLRQKETGSIVEKELPIEYFVVWAYDHHGDYVGQSELRPAYGFSKKKDLLGRIWNLFLERYATPTPLGKYKPGTPPAEQSTILSFLSTLHAKKAAVVPETWSVEMLESKRSGGDYEAALKYCDRMIGRAVLIPSLLMDEGQSGSYSLGKEHADSFMWVLDALGEECAREVMDAQVIRRLVDWNFAVERYPTFEWLPYAATDFAVLAAGFVSLVNGGILAATDPVIRERLDLPPAADGDAPDSAARKPSDGRSTEPPTPAGASSAASAATVPPATTSAASAGGGGGADRAPIKVALSAPDKPTPTGGGRHLRKADWRAMSSGLDAIETPAIDAVSAAMRAMRDQLLKTVKARRIVDDRDLSAVENLRLPGLGELRAGLEAAFGNALQMGAYHGKLEIERGLKDAGTPHKLKLSDTMRTNFSEGWYTRASLPDGRRVELSADDAWSAAHPECNFALNEILAAWAQKVPIQKQLLAAYNRQAFTIAGVYRDDILSKAQAIIGKGIRRGATYDQVASEIGSLFEPYLATPGALDPAVADPWRIENMVRTNTAEAYSTGRWNLFKDPEVNGFVEAFEYSAVMDDRTTDFCREWNGKVLNADDPIFASINPPNHYGCRSVLIPIVTGERWMADDPSSLPSIRPADGFGM